MDSENSSLPKDVQTGLGHMAEALAAAKVSYALIGGIAVGFHSRPRFTNDVDFLLNVPQIKLPGLLDELRGRGFDIDTAKTIEEWTKHHLTVVDFHGVRFDWLKPVLPLYTHVIHTAKPVLWNGGSLLIASPESLILTKLIAFRGQDQADIEALLAANRGQVDIAYIRSEWATIAPEDDPRIQRFLEMVKKFDKPA
jgi:hypothetical protein